eukprot:TRINITY_DN4093_c0_g1_i1.p1 TRINITY_DN4093_c0_g1~~TRINITY_DN4093_c0_g1_i1.p1  ORF type:complete len:492 (+),score=124.09 TRINITY_DN4093_c0_g1_i1:76-1476(+)
MAQYSEAEVAGFLDVEGQSPVESLTSSQRPRGWRIHQLFAAAAGTAVVGSSGALLMRHHNNIVATTPAAVPSDATKLSARMLFESPAIHDVATENVMSIKSRIPQSRKSREEVRHLVAKTFKDIVQNMQQQAPEMYEALEKTELTQQHHEGIVYMMRYLKDPRVMQLGLDTAKAIQEAKSDDEDVLTHHIKSKLQNRAKEIQEIYTSMPGSLQDLATSRPGDGFKSIFKPKKLQALKTLGGRWYEQFTQVPAETDDERRLVFGNYATPHSSQPSTFSFANPAQHPTTPPYGHSTMYQQPPPAHSWLQHGASHSYHVAEEVLGIIGTAVAEADTMVRIINPLEKIFPGAHDLEIPPWVTTALGGGDFALQMADCEMDAVADKNAEEMIGCPAMGASAGFDMMREPFTLMGLLGDNNKGNGHQGNHAGHSAKQGIFDDGRDGMEMKKEAAGHFPACLFWGNCKKPEQR